MMNNMINMMYNNNNNLIRMNNMGMNQNGINNQQNLINNMNMNNPMNINNPMNMINNNPMNMNNPINIFNMNNPMNMIRPSNNQFLPINNKEIKLKVKFENNVYNIVCFQNDKASILRQKVNMDIGRRDFVYYYKCIDPELTLEENEISERYDIPIEIKEVKTLIFEFNGKTITLRLSDDCPLNLAISYYLAKLQNPFIILAMIENILNLIFLYNAKKLDIRQKTPLNELFKEDYPRLKLAM